MREREPIHRPGTPGTIMPYLPRMMRFSLSSNFVEIRHGLGSDDRRGEQTASGQERRVERRDGGEGRGWTESREASFN